MNTQEFLLQEQQNNIKNQKHGLLVSFTALG